MNIIIDSYLDKLTKSNNKIPYNNNIDKSETDEFIIWLIKWNSYNITTIIYNKKYKIYSTNLNYNSPFWPNICNNLINILQKNKIIFDSNLIMNNFLIESSNPFDICSICFGITLDEI